MPELEKQSTLREFILSEMQRRGMSQRQFADFVGVASSTIVRALGYSDPPTPSLEFLKKLSDKTGVSVSSLVLLALPDASEPSPEAIMLAERIKRLPPEKREIIEAFILGTLLDKPDG